MSSWSFINLRFRSPSASATATTSCPVGANSDEVVSLISNADDASDGLIHVDERQTIGLLLYAYVYLSRPVLDGFDGVAMRFGRQWHSINRRSVIGAVESDRESRNGIASK
ncbi:Uncharacterized protein APZ42_029078 [Daphnia magna]|uniref:Uncharacterized protein n=1 Tax=Daphnia magna TaxID=35525 RepID=A0A164PY03_9CRUS|nr:Uncharacterized protein APZ42_029078 [Daphnia magna]